MGQGKIVFNMLSYENIKGCSHNLWLFTSLNGWFNIDSIFSARSHHKKGIN